MNVQDLARQIYAIDVALRKGCDVKFEGKMYTFTPLTLGDFAEHMKRRRSEALDTYLAVAGKTVTDSAERFHDIHDILQRGARESDFAMNDPQNMLSLSWLSLRHLQPEITHEDVDALLTDDETRETMVAILNIESFGPIPKSKLDEEDQSVPFDTKSGEAPPSISSKQSAN